MGTTADRDPVEESDELLDQLTLELRASACEIVDRVRRTMPAAYFNDTDRATMLVHLKAIIAGGASGLPQEIRLRSRGGERFTFIHERSYPGQLAELVRQLPHDRPLMSANVHTATDGALVLDVFEFGQAAGGPADAAMCSEVCQRTIRYAREHSIDLQPDEVRRHLQDCDGAYLDRVLPGRICDHVRLLRHVRGSEDSAVELVARQDVSMSDLRVGVGHVDARMMFERIARYLGHLGVDIRRAYLNSFDADPEGPTSLVEVLVSTPEHGPPALLATEWPRIKLDLLRLKWLDEPTLELAYRLPGWSLTDAETLVALCRMGHQVLIRREGPGVAYQSVLEIAERNPLIAKSLVDLLSDPADNPRVAPPETRPIGQAINDGVDSENARRVLGTLLQIVESCGATNVARPQRYATSIEVDPALLHAQGEDVPRGVIFVHGRDFDGFHVRFRDIARGGLRIVRPRSWEQHTLENERLYQEAHGLALSQQLKNKDIPEGGSKGVILLEPRADADSAGRAYADALLDLLVQPDAAGVDQAGRMIYLGPDENVTDGLICWIVDRAERRGYPMPNAFMSSKPGVGINHKQYGVTSEGITVFLEVALRHIGIRPRRQAFSIKLTGGPDGDVAGNEIRILHREYGENARIVGIADGSGSAEDPAGLYHGELLRLTERALPIAEFDRTLLGPTGRVLGADEPGGLRARNTLHNRVRSDVFVPAGGRPRTIHEGNWEAFLTADGTPSSRVIVEGANLFLTSEARRHLSDRGAVIIKDSSANKCGVICSSFEVLASMVWTEQRFLELKPRFVEDVIDKLRELARLEAELLFDEHLHRPALSLPELSTRLSEAIIRAADSVTAGIGALGVESRDLIRHLAASHFPKVLVEDLGERLFDRIPPGYIDSAVATALASRIVYREGLAYVEDMPPEGINDLALRYLREELAISRLMDQVEHSELPERRRIADLLREGGARAALRHRTPGGQAPEGSE